LLRKNPTNEVFGSVREKFIEPKMTVHLWHILISKVNASSAMLMGGLISPFPIFFNLGKMIKQFLATSVRLIVTIFDRPNDPKIISSHL
jgi:hypothetical protein